MKAITLKVVALAISIAPVTALAATFTIALSEYNLGDPGADWFGTFKLPRQAEQCLRRRSSSTA